MAILIVGACYNDICVTVDTFPLEDSKTTAKTITHERGGNGANSAVVLAILSQSMISDHFDPGESKISFMASMPEDSLSHHTLLDLKGFGIDLKGIYLVPGTCCNTHMPQAMIIRSLKTCTRTILSHNPLPAFPTPHFYQFVSGYEALSWIHFEGRAISDTVNMLEWIDNHFKDTKRPVISVELEKPYREGIENLARYADIIFMSKAFLCAKAEKWGIKASSRQQPSSDDQAHDVVYQTLGKFHVNHVFGCDKDDDRISAKKCTYVVTWGERGAFATETFCNVSEIGALMDERVPCFKGRSIVDTNGAGDTFIGSFIYFYMGQKGLKYALTKAVEIASLKCTVRGFAPISSLLRMK